MRTDTRRAVASRLTRVCIAGGRVGALRALPAVALIALAACSGRGDEPAVTPDDEASPRLIDVPGELRATTVSSGSVALAWQPPVGDDSDAYEVLRGEALIGVSNSGRFLDEEAPTGASRYAVRGRRVDAIEGIDVTTEPVEREVSVPRADALAVRVGGAPVSPDIDVDGLPNVTIDARGRTVATGQQGDLFAVHRMMAGARGPTRFVPGLDAPRLLAGTDVWFLLGDDGEARPLLALDPDTLETRWQLETTSLALTGGCRFARLLSDGALSCRGFADDTLRIDAAGDVSPTAPGVRVPTGERRSADDGQLLVDVWTLPVGSEGDRFVPVHEWVLRDVTAGEAVDLGTWLRGDPALTFPHTVRSVAVVDGTIVIAGDVLANGCLRLCVEELAVPLFIDGHFVASVDREAGRIAALERLPLGLGLGDGVHRAADGVVEFAAIDRLTRIDSTSLAVLDTIALGGEPVGIAASAILTRVSDGDGVDWYRFAR